MWWYAPQIGLLLGKFIRRRMDRVEKTTTYDPVFDVVAPNSEEIYHGIGIVATEIYENPGAVAATGIAIGGRYHPGIAAGSIVYDLYRGANWFESRYPGKAEEWFHHTLSATSDAHRYWTGDYDFETYSVKGDSWENYHRQKTRPRYRGVNPREFV